MAEAAKLSAEERKLGGETAKMWAEAWKLERDRKLSPWLIGVGGAGAIGGIIAGIGTLVRLFL
jgi:hypothetical protein